MTKKCFVYLLVFFGLFVCSGRGYTQSNKGYFGAYYFDGWKKIGGNTHLTPSLKTTFSERQPVWGWVTSKQDIIDKQIIAASDAGLSFFSFCWYYKNTSPIDSTNQSLYFFNNSPERSRLKFTLLVANHQGYEYGPDEWPALVAEWIKQFKKENYLNVNGKPLVTFFSVSTLVNKFKSAANVRAALDSLRLAARKAGLNGVTIAACCSDNPQTIKQAKACGFDVLTGYNYHSIGLANAQGQEVPIEKMQSIEYDAWSKIANASALKYIPVVTLNWDPRPWATPKNKYATAPYFTGFSPNSVQNSIANCIKWMNNNPSAITSEKIVILYAWNEYGEGAWLTPGMNGISMLDGVKKATGK